MPAYVNMRVQVISHNVGALYSESRLDRASYSGPSPAGMSADPTALLYLPDPLFSEARYASNHVTHVRCC